jgi:tRNA A-37 threonylcarbamoyl transferase component Bud32
VRPHPPALAPPALGRYRLGPVLGRGATSIVYRAEDLATGAEVAVKRIPVDLDLDARVRAEVRAASRLDHPAIVPLLDWGEDAHALYLVWELVEGQSLFEHLRDGRGVAAGHMVRIVSDVLGALQHAHERGVVHRDVKPANILVTVDGRARLADFGVARLVDEAGLTLTGGVVGTVAYMAPEQALGEPAGAPADVYAAALVLYEGLSGSNPISADGPAETARRAAASEIPPLHAARPDLPLALCRHVDAALARDPRDRPSAQGLAERLGASRMQIGVRGQGLRALPALASAAGGAALTAVALETGSGMTRGAILAAALAAGALCAWRPREAALLIGGGALGLLARIAPALAAVVGALGLALLLAARPAHPSRLLLLPAAAPALFAIGLGPLFAAAAGTVDRWTARLWVAVAGVGATLVWQVTTGAPGVLFSSVPRDPALDDLRGAHDVTDAAHRLADPLTAHPAALVGGAGLVVAAMAVPLVTGARAGAPRMLAALVWAGLMSAAILLAPGARADAAGAVLPACVLVVAWGLQPWRRLGRLGRLGSRPASATLRGRTP